VRSFLGRLKAGWLRVAHAIGRFNTRVVLTIVFGTLFAVMNLFIRLARKDLLRARAGGASTHWVAVDPPSDEDPFVAHRRQF
jgi:hypothetical protein